MPQPVLKPFSGGPVSFTVGPPPHWRSHRTVSLLMLESCMAFIPILLFLVVMHGIEGLRVPALAAAVAVITEVAVLRLQNRMVNVENLTALHAGLLFGFMLPISAPWWMVALGAVLTITMGRAVFGGFGSNPLCAPLVAWAMLKVSWPGLMDIDSSMPYSLLADPLAQLKAFGLSAVATYDSWDGYGQLLLGQQLGAAGTACGLAVLAGGVFLVVRGWVRPPIPVGFLIGVFLTAEIYHLINPEVYASGVFHLLTGSVLFGAFFLAPDYASSPVGRVPSLIFGLVAGWLVVIIRIYGVFPDGVAFAILLANLLSPLLDLIRPKPFGRG
ncbi:MAG: RnfABCDGE type electron transport complex subunit D [Desulfovibrio sp.]